MAPDCAVALLRRGLEVEMRADVPSSEVMWQSFWLDTVLGGQSPRMRQLADCIGRIRPAVARVGRDYDDRNLIWALAAIAVHLAVESGHAPGAAAMFRANARLLELAGGGLPNGQPPAR